MSFHKNNNNTNTSCSNSNHSNYSLINSNSKSSSSKSVKSKSFKKPKNENILASKRTRRALWEAFDFFDKDHDGCINCEELQSVFEMLGKTVNIADIKAMISQVDTDGNGTVEYNEFLSMMKHYGENHANSTDIEMHDAFKAFDLNGDNYIDFHEIKQTMHSLGEMVSDADVKAMIKEADVDNDGRINFEEFKKMMELLRKKS